MMGAGISVSSWSLARDRPCSSPTTSMSRREYPACERRIRWRSGGSMNGPRKGASFIGHTTTPAGDFPAAGSSTKGRRTGEESQLQSTRLLTTVAELGSLGGDEFCLARGEIWLNIKAYLDRISYHGSLAPTAETLR